MKMSDESIADWDMYNLKYHIAMTILLIFAILYIPFSDVDIVSKIIAMLLFVFLLVLTNIKYYNIWFEKKVVK